MNLKKPLGIAALAISLVLVSGCWVQTVAYVDVLRYAGSWYQIAANPTFFNEGLVGVTANYTLQDDGTIKVLNSGFVDRLDGEPELIEGLAVVADPVSNASLAVSFPGQPELPFPNYLIVVLDEVDYQYAAVTDPLFTTLFILSRTPQMDDKIYQQIITQLEAKGVPTEQLLLTPQPAYGGGAIAIQGAG